jgi:hypothetical protein
LAVQSLLLILQQYFVLENIMAFKISGLSREQFQELFDLTDTELAVRGAKRYVADAKPGFPCRVSLIDANAGERVILVPFKHQPGKTPYHATGPIFVRETAEVSELQENEVPEMLRNRLLSLRAYDAQDLLVAADVVGGMEVENLLRVFFDNAAVSYIHVHFAKPGCYACRVDRLIGNNVADSDQGHGAVVMTNSETASN